MEESYALGKGEASEDKTHIVIGWLLGKAADREEALRSELLSQVLLGDSAAPLMKALETTALGAAPRPALYRMLSTQVFGTEKARG